MQARILHSIYSGIEIGNEGEILSIDPNTGLAAIRIERSVIGLFGGSNMKEIAILGFNKNEYEISIAAEALQDVKDKTKEILQRLQNDLDRLKVIYG